MNLRLFFFILGSMICSSSALALQSVLHETLTIFSRPGSEVRGVPDFPALPTRTGAGFGAAGRSSLTGAGQGGGVASVSKRRYPVCGPSSAINSMVCHGLENGNLLGEYPLPGALSTTPVFFEDGWLIGTTEGFLIRTNRPTGGQAMPLFDSSLLYAFWGAEARKVMAGLRKNVLPAEYKWVQYTTAEFTGTPIIVNNVVLATASNQFLYGIDWGTGRVLWTLRLAPDTAMRLQGDSIAVVPGRKEGEVVVGTSEGLFLGVSVATGQVQWRHRLPNGAGERFHSAIAKAKPMERSLLLASAEGVVQRVAIDRCLSESVEGGTRCVGDSRLVEWTYPIGTIISPLVLGSRVAVGGNDGSVVLLDGARSGALLWKKSLFNVPVAAMASLPAQAPQYLLAVSATGEIVLVDFSGKVRGSMDAVGVPAGEFFPGRNAEEVCLSFAIPTLRCFSIAY